MCVGGSSIHNLITHAYIPDDYVPQIINIDSTGQKLYEEYVLERIYRYRSLWDIVKKRKNLMYSSGNIKRLSKLGTRM